MNVKGWVFILLGLSLLLSSGCALQADMVDAQLDLDQLKAEQREIKRRMGEFGGSFEERSFSAQQNQADLGVRVDQLGIDFQILQGRMEENEHTFAELSRRLDDQSYRITELLAKVDSLERRSVMGKLEVPEVNSPKPESPAGEKTVLPGRTIVPKELESKRVPGAVRPEEGTGERVGGLTPTEAYNLAYNDYIRGNYDLALIGFQNFLTQFPNSSLLPSAQYWLGESYFNRQEYGKAVNAFQALLERYPQTDKAPTAMLKEGYAYLELGDKWKARNSLKKVVEQFPFTNEAKLAKEKLAEIR